MGAAKNIGSVLGPFTSTAIFPTSVAYILLLMGIMWFIVYCFLIAAWETMYVEKDEYAELKEKFEHEMAEIEKKSRIKKKIELKELKTYGTMRAF